jgi:hypothetical protein
MFRMAVGHSDDIDLETAVATVLDECAAALDGLPPSAGILYVAWDVDRQAVARAVVARFPGIALIGATSAGEMTSVIGLAEDSVALALFASDNVEITAGLGLNLLADPAAAARQAVNAAQARTTQPARLCVALPAVGGYEARDLFDGLRGALGPDVPVVGGGSSPADPASPPGTTDSLQIVGDQVTADSIAVLLFSGDLNVSIGVETGWRGIGPRGVVTRTSADGVLEIDGRPAMEFYERYVGLGQPPLANPMAVWEDATAGTFYLRTPSSADTATGLVAFFGTVPVGATVQITTAGTEQIFDGARASVLNALERYPSGAKPSAALIYSCATRKFLLGTRAAQEVELVRDTLGRDVPIAGFYCLGEIAPKPPLLDRTEFHNATLVSVLLGAG